MMNFIDRLLADEMYAKLAHTESIDEIANLIELSGVWSEAEQNEFFRVALNRMQDLGVKLEDFDEPRTAEFNPNQPRDEHGRWTDGDSGTADWRTDKFIDSNGYIQNAEMGQLATMIARSHGFKGEIVVKDYDKSFEVGGRKFHEAGHYSPSDGDITLRREAMKSMQTSTFEGIIAHEVAHDAFHSTYGVAEEYSYNYEGFEKLGPSAELYTHIKEHSEELRARDGISDYSEAYWKEVAALEAVDDINDQLYDDTFKRAVNETLAETAKYLVVKQAGNDWLLKTRFKGREPADIWLKTYAMMKNAYKQAKNADA